MFRQSAAYRHLTNTLYRRGTTKSVIMVDTPNPHIIEEATGPQSSELPPNPVARESKPAIVVNEVMMTGITRRLPA